MSLDGRVFVCLSAVLKLIFSVHVVLVIYETLLKFCTTSISLNLEKRIYLNQIQLLKVRPELNIKYFGYL